MARPQEIRIFNPFRMQHGSNIAMHLKIQEVLNYAESRFSSVVIALDRHAGSQDVRHYLQRRLLDELVKLLFIILYMWEN